MKTVYLTICFMPITMKNGNSKLYMLEDLLLSLNLYLSEIIKKKRNYEFTVNIKYLILFQLVETNKKQQRTNFIDYL